VYDKKNQPLVFHVDTSSGKIKVKGTIDEENKKHRAEVKKAIADAKSQERLIESEYKNACNTEGAESTKAKLLYKSLTSKKLDTLKASSRLNDITDWEPEEDWHRKALFLKIIRGDVGDGIFSANPGVRYKGSKKSVGIEDAWDDRHERGFNWNNFMLKRWEKLVENEKIEVKVIDEYHKNEMLIDLTKQPQEIVDLMDTTIVDAVQKPNVTNVGIHFARFCKSHELNRLSSEAADFVKFLGAPYSS
jgi:hypothetical protein